MSRRLINFLDNYTSHNIKWEYIEQNWQVAVYINKTTDDDDRIIQQVKTSKRTIYRCLINEPNKYKSEAKTKCWRVSLIWPLS